MFTALAQSAAAGLTQEIPPVLDRQIKAKSLVNETTALRPIDSKVTFTEPRPRLDNRSTEKKEISTNQLQAKKSSKLLIVVDTILTFVFIGPLVSIYWYSTWALCDYYIFRSNLEASYWTSFTVGCTVIAIATLLQDEIVIFSDNRRKPFRYILMRVFTYILSVASVSQWRGVWDLEDYYTGISSVNAALTYISVTVVLICLRGQRSALCSPTTLCVDVRPADHYKLATFWNIPPGPSLKFVLDTLCTAFVIEPLTISVWRGLWELIDCQVYHDDEKMRIVVCMVGYLGTAFIVSLLQVPIQRLAAYLENVNWYLMLAFENLITALYVALSVTSWRGFWLVFEQYAPRQPGYLWLYHYLSFGILVAGLAANSAMTQVSPRDGSLPDGQGATLELSYTARIISAWRSKTDF
ncbi:unnamed protein product, partial [Candidula unifasciata]